MTKLEHFSGFSSLINFSVTVSKNGKLDHAGFQPWFEVLEGPKEDFVFNANFCLTQTNEIKILEVGVQTTMECLLPKGFCNVQPKLRITGLNSHQNNFVQN